MTTTPLDDDPAGTTPPVVETRQLLIDAALKVFVDRGYRARVQDIARAAGFTSGAMYVHFASRSELLDEAIAIEAARLMDQLATASDEDRESFLSNRLSCRLVTEGLALLARQDDARVRDALDRLMARSGAGTELLGRIVAGAVAV